MFATLKAMTAVWAWLAAGGAVVLGALAVAWFVPFVRQFALGIAVAAAVAVFYAGHLVQLEHDVCEAKQAQAEVAAAKRDADEAKAAAADANNRAADLEVQANLDKETIDAYAKRLAKSPACLLTPDDLR